MHEIDETCGRSEPVCVKDVCSGLSLIKVEEFEAWRGSCGSEGDGSYDDVHGCGDGGGDRSVLHGRREEKRRVLYRVRKSLLDLLGDELYAVARTVGKLYVPAGTTADGMATLAKKKICNLFGHVFVAGIELVGYEKAAGAARARGNGVACKAVTGEKMRRGVFNYVKRMKRK